MTQNQVPRYAHSRNIVDENARRILPIKIIALVPRTLVPYTQIESRSGLSLFRNYQLLHWIVSIGTCWVTFKWFPESRKQHWWELENSSSVNAMLLRFVDRNQLVKEPNAKLVNVHIWWNTVQITYTCAIIWTHKHGRTQAHRCKCKWNFKWLWIQRRRHKTLLRARLRILKNCSIPSHWNHVRGCTYFKLDDDGRCLYQLWSRYHHRKEQDCINRILLKGDFHSRGRSRWLRW